MTDEQFKKLSKIQGEIHDLEELERSLDGCSPSLGMSINCKTGYSDMGHDIERHLNIKGDIALECWCAIRDLTRNRLTEMRKKFEKIKIEGV